MVHFYVKLREQESTVSGPDLNSYTFFFADEANTPARNFQIWQKYWAGRWTPYYYDGAIHDFALILHICTDKVCHQYFRLRDDNIVILVVCTILTTILIQYMRGAETWGFS
jgi:hypothetical protein